MEDIFFAMKSATGVILAGSAQPTHVTPVIGKARSCRRRATLDVTDAPSSLSSAIHVARPFAAVVPPKAAPAMSRLAELSPPSALSTSSSSSLSSYSRGRPRFLRSPPPPLRCRSLMSLSPRTLAVLEPPSRSPRPRISSSIIDIGLYMESCLLLCAPPPRPAAAAHTGCCGVAPPPAPSRSASPPAACGRLAAFTASPCASGGTDPSSSLSDISPVPRLSLSKT